MNNKLNYILVKVFFVAALLVFLAIGIVMCSHFAASMTTFNVPAVNCMATAIEECLVAYKEGSFALVVLSGIAASFIFSLNILLLYSGYGGFVRQNIRARNAGAKLNSYLLMALARGILHPRTY